jgi:electron transfer flavoprotein alpha subunit
MATLVLAEVHGTKLNEATAKAVTAAADIGQPVHVVVVGENVRGAAEEAAKIAGVEKVHLAEGPEYAHQLAEPVAALLVKMAEHHPVIVAPATSAAKNIMPRVAALLDVMQVSEISKVVSPDTFERPIYAGNAVQTVQTSDAKKVITVRTAAFKATGEGGNAAIGSI